MFLVDVAKENVIVILHPPTQRVLTLIPTMEMEAILAKMVSGRISSVLILYLHDFWFSRPDIPQKPKVVKVLLHLEALSSPENQWMNQGIKKVVLIPWENYYYENLRQ